MNPRPPPTALRNESEATADGTPGAPEIISAYDTYQSSREIRVEWLASEDDGGCSDSVYEYRIYRATVEGVYSANPVGILHADDSELYFWLDNLSYSADPPQDGLTYWYTIRAYDAVNDLFSMASNEFGPVEPYGENCDCCPIFQDDFEGGNLGWTSGGSRNDWQLGRPRGKSFDPSVAHSGANVRGNDIGEGSYDGMYRARADNYVISPTIDLSGYSSGTVTLKYWRWLSVEDGDKDEAEVLVYDGEDWIVIWTNTTEGNTIDSGWKEQLLDLTSYGVLGKSNIQLAWSMDSNNSSQFGGWNIDDVEVCYTSPGPCDEFIYVGNSANVNNGNNVFFNITNISGHEVELRAMTINWPDEGGLLKSISTTAGGPGGVWTTAVAEGPELEATFQTVVPFAVGETIRFKFQYQPGNMGGRPLELTFTSECGSSTTIFITMPG